MSHDGISLWLQVRRLVAIALLIGSLTLAAILPLVLAYLYYYPTFDSVEEWTYAHGINWLWPIVHWVLFVIPWLVASFAGFLFERHVAEKLGSWLVSILHLPVSNREVLKDDRPAS